MMQQEFENLLGYRVSPEQYGKIERVYMGIEKLTKEKIAELYKNDEFFVTDTLFSHVADVNNLKTGNLNLKTASDKLEKEFDFLKKLVIKRNDDYTRLQERFNNLDFDNDINCCRLKCCRENIKKLEKENEELQAQLHQYQALFADMEKNMTVSLYTTLTGIAQ